jgi:hypothetical protein
MACVTLGPDEVEIPDAVAETLEQDGVLWFDPIATSQWHGYVYHPMGTSTPNSTRISGSPLNMPSTLNIQLTRRTHERNSGRKTLRTIPFA